MVPDALKQFVCKLNISAQANCARERQDLLRDRTTSTGLSRGRKHPKTTLLSALLDSVARSLNEGSRFIFLAPKGADLKWLAWVRRPFLRSEMDQVNHAPLDPQDLPEVPLARGLSISISSRP
eukprot:SAG11_NODE_1321_length_5207_cov_66.406617_5_plen_123_part_00